MRSKAIFVALLALAFGAQAAHVSQEEAAVAAGAWAGTGEKLGVRLGADVESVREFSVTNGYSFYAVKVGGGTVIMTSDTALEPVVAFSTRGDLDLSAGSPLHKMLSRDVAARAAIAAMEESESAQASGGRIRAAAAAPAKSATTLWATLLRGAQAAGQGGRIRAAASADPVDSVSDVRVAPLVKSEWRQDYATTNPVPLNCYNYYTPSNYVCGCTATAMSQIMRYFEWPKEAMAPRTYECTVDKKTVELTTQGGVYDWDNMTLIPELAALFDMMADVNCRAIGKLTSDAGIAVKSSYSDGDTGADPRDVAAALREAFGYSDAICYWNAAGWNTGRGGLHLRPMRERVIYTNLDAGQPVQLAIYGYDPNGNWAGHAVVADGYGYMTVDGVETAFVHINMGWAGTDDMWYNIPEINAAKSGAHVGDVGLDFLYLGGAIFNISTNDTGLSILSGRLTDGAGAAVAGATVYVFGADGAQVGETVSDAHGIYFFKLAGGVSYSLKATSPDGSKIGEIAAMNLPATTGLDDKFVVTDSAKVGNSWGNDMAFADPAARIVVGTETNLFLSLDTAIAAARYMARSLGVTPEVEMLMAIDLNADARIDFPCVIRAAPGSEAEAVVGRPYDAAIAVEAGASLVVSNCAFEVTHSTPLSVAAGGRLFIGPGFSASRVDAADADGLNVIGLVPCDLSVFCAVAMEPGLAFGHATTDDPEALSNTVARLTTKFYETGEAVGSLVEVSPGEYLLVWAEAPVPLANAVGYFVTADGTTNTSDRVDILIGRYEHAQEEGNLPATPEIVLIGRDDRGLSRDIVVATPLSIRGTGSAFLVPSDAAHIVVTNGGSLAVRDVAIGDRTGDTFIRVLDGGSMTLGEGAVLTNLVCSGNMAIGGKKSFEPVDAGPVAVVGGTLRLEPGSTIVGCAATGSAGGGRQGGGVYLGDGAVLDLAGGTITNCCSVNNYGGGVYATMDATVVVSGPSVVAGNVNKNNKADDVYFIYGDSSTNRVCVTNSAAGGSIGVRYSSSLGNAVGFAFAETSFAVPPNEVATNSAAAFFSDADASRRGVPVDDGEACFFEWRNGVEAADSHAGNVVRVEYPDGMTQDFDHLQYAFESLMKYEPGNAKVTFLRNDWFAEDLSVAEGWSIEFDSAGDTPKTVRRRGGASISVVEGASVSISNLVFSSRPQDVADSSYFAVSGGSLELLSGAEISDVLADGRFGAAVTVTNGGAFAMLDGSLIARCTNSYVYASDRTAYAGALLVKDEGSVAYLFGGAITNCLALRAGGVCVDNGAEIRLSGGASVYGNYVDGDTIGNVVVAHQSFLVLDGVLTGTVGDRADAGADKALIGRVDDGFPGSDDELVESAMNFRNDEGYGYGVPVRSEDGSTTLLVWSGRIAVDGTYTDPDGDVYSIVISGVPYPVDVPAAPDLVYNGEEQTGFAPHFGYVLSGTLSATGAGSYVAVATLSDGYVWEDGTTEAKELPWTIEKATYDMSGVTFEGSTFPYDGEKKSIFVSGELPDGVSVNYFGNGESRPGEYIVTAAFTGDYENYNGIPFLTATLTIVGGPPSVLPELPEGADADDVAEALAAAGLADDAVAENINGSGDPVALYEAFKEWAEGVDGGEAAVKDSEHAWVSFEFGVDELFENEPTVTFTSMSIENPAEASMRVRLVVKDGDAEKDVDPDSVAKLFEMSANLVTWTDDLTVEYHDDDGSYTVKPDDPTLPAAFIRLRY